MTNPMCSERLTEMPTTPNKVWESLAEVRANQCQLLNILAGQLLTFVEALFVPGQQLEAVKSTIRERINQTRNLIDHDLDMYFDWLPYCDTPPVTAAAESADQG